MEKNMKKNVYVNIYMYKWITLQYNGNSHSIIIQL